MRVRAESTYDLETVSASPIKKPPIRLAHDVLKLAVMAKGMGRAMAIEPIEYLDIFRGLLGNYSCVRTSASRETTYGHLRQRLF